MGVYPPETGKSLDGKPETAVRCATKRYPADDARDRQMLRQAEILIRMNRSKECTAVLDQIPENPLLRSDISLLRGRLALGEGLALKKAAAKKPLAAEPREDGEPPVLTPAPTPEQEGNHQPSPPAPTPGHHVLVVAGEESKEKFRLAIELFRKADSARPLGDNRVARQATYLIGLCLMEQGDFRLRPLNQFEARSEAFPETAESLAALYQQGGIAAAWAVTKRRCRPICGSCRPTPGWTSSTIRGSICRKYARRCSAFARNT